MNIQVNKSLCFFRKKIIVLLISIFIFIEFITALPIISFQNIDVHADINYEDIYLFSKQQFENELFDSNCRFGYALIDIDCDGIDEFIISREFPWEQGSIARVYSYKNGEVICWGNFNPYSIFDIRILDLGRICSVKYYAGMPGIYCMSILSNSGESIETYDDTEDDYSQLEKFINEHSIGTVEFEYDTFSFPKSENIYEIEFETTENEQINIEDFEEIPEIQYKTSLDGDYVLEICGDEAIIIEYRGNSTNLVIPEIIDGYKITGIDGKREPENDYLNYGAFENNDIIKVVTLPSSITMIGDYAFSNCALLSLVKGATNVKTIGNYAFFNCPLLTEYPFSTKNSVIKNYAFAGCSISEIVIPRELSELGEKAFGCFSDGSINSNCILKCHYLKENKKLTLGSEYINKNKFKNHEYLYDNIEEEFIGTHYYFNYNDNDELFFESFYSAYEDNPLKDVMEFKGSDIVAGLSYATQEPLDVLLLDIKAIHKDLKWTNDEDMYKLAMFDVLNQMSDELIIDKTKEIYQKFLEFSYNGTKELQNLVKIFQFVKTLTN